MSISKPMTISKILQERFKERMEVVVFSKQVHGWIVRSEPKNVEANKDVEHCFQLSH